MILNSIKINKNLIFLVLLLIFIGFFAGIVKAESVESPKINIWPETYISGEEIFYIEGDSFPGAEIIILLKKDEKIIKKWEAFANSKGEWSFSTKKLLKSGTYYLSAQAKSKEGTLSSFSESQKIEISLSGMSLGPIIASFRGLTVFLSIISFLGLISLCVFLYKITQTRKRLQKETQEVKDVFSMAFSDIRKEIKEQIEMFDSQSGFNPKEREVYENLMISLEKSERDISKEIRDVEKELR